MVVSPLRAPHGFRPVGLQVFRYAGLRVCGFWKLRGVAVRLFRPFPRNQRYCSAISCDIHVPAAEYQYDGEPPFIRSDRLPK
ncbi:protein of unknown function [Pararobbsia alpina]